MEGDEDWDVFRTGSPYKYKFEVTEHVQDNIFNGESNCIMGEGVEDQVQAPKKRKLNLIHLQDDNAVLSYNNLAKTFTKNDFSPFFKMTSDITHNKSGTIFGVGGDLGIPLKVWMKSQGKTIWEYYAGDIYKRPGKDWRFIGRLIGAGVYANHINDLFIGNLLNSSYVRDGKIIFVKDPQIANTLSTVTGIQNDLRELITFVGWVQQEIPVLNPARNQPRMDDIAVFNDTFPQNYPLPNTLPELKELSYFLCHHFLYFEDVQRFSFCDAFRRMRTTIPNFDLSVPFTGNNFISKNWESGLPKDLDTCFTFNKHTHEGACGQIHFHRSCLHHYNDKAKDKLDKKDLDEELINVLPLTIPRGFSAFFKCLIPQADKIKELKRDINYLKQYKLEI